MFAAVWNAPLQELEARRVCAGLLLAVVPAFRVRAPGAAAGVPAQRGLAKTAHNITARLKVRKQNFSILVTHGWKIGMKP